MRKGIYQKKKIQTSPKLPFLHSPAVSYYTLQPSHRNLNQFVEESMSSVSKNEKNNTFIDNLKILNNNETNV